MVAKDELSVASAKLLNSVVREDGSIGRRVLVVQALQCLDRLNEVREQLKTEKQPAPRYGLIELETKLRGQFVKAWRLAGLAYNAIKDGRIE